MIIKFTLFSRNCQRASVNRASNLFVFAFLLTIICPKAFATGQNPFELYAKNKHNDQSFYKDKTTGNVWGPPYTNDGQGMTIDAAESFCLSLNKTDEDGDADSFYSVDKVIRYFGTASSKLETMRWKLPEIDEWFAAGGNVVPNQRKGEYEWSNPIMRKFLPYTNGRYWAPIGESVWFSFWRGGVSEFGNGQHAWLHTKRYYANDLRQYPRHNSIPTTLRCMGIADKASPR